jgi:hypothetical protein
MMQKNEVLAINNQLGNIQQCACGTVHLHCGNVSLRFREDQFMSFALMVREASSRLVDRGLSDLLESGRE